MCLLFFKLPLKAWLKLSKLMNTTLVATAQERKTSEENRAVPVVLINDDYTNIPGRLSPSCQHSAEKSSPASGSRCRTEPTPPEDETHSPERPLTRTHQAWRQTERSEAESTYLQDNKEVCRLIKSTVLEAHIIRLCVGEWPPGWFLKALWWTYYIRQQYISRYVFSCLCHQSFMRTRYCVSRQQSSGGTKITETIILQSNSSLKDAYLTTAAKFRWYRITSSINLKISCCWLFISVNFICMSGASSRWSPPPNNIFPHFFVCKMSHESLN